MGAIKKRFALQNLLCNVVLFLSHIKWFCIVEMKIKKKKTIERKVKTVVYL